MRTCLPDPALPAPATPVTPPSLRGQLIMPPCHPRPRPRPALPLHSPQVAWRTCTVQYPQSSSSLCRVRVASHRRVPLPSSLQAVLCLPLDWATRQSGRRGRERERRNLLFVATGESAKRSTRPRRGSERPRPGCRGSSRTVGERSTLYVVCLRLVDVLILTRRLHYRQAFTTKIVVFRILKPVQQLHVHTYAYTEYI